MAFLCRRNLALRLLVRVFTARGIRCSVLGDSNPLADGNKENYNHNHHQNHNNNSHNNNHNNGAYWKEHQSKDPGFKVRDDDSE